MKRYLIYFSPILILIILMQLVFVNVIPLYVDHEWLLFLKAAFYAVLLLSVYWAVGFWIPGQHFQTLFSVISGFILLQLTGYFCSGLNVLYMASLVPVALLSIALIRRHHT